ncbi:hypothetical protein IAT38_000798 [Cryptococcus sp. DSM 104549]
MIRAARAMSNPLKLKALLIDLNGTLHVGSDPTPSAVEALQRLRAARIPFVFCSNSTKESSASLLGKLQKMGFEAKEEELLTSLGACKLLVEEKGLERPLLLMSPSAKEEFSSLPDPSDTAGYDSVILGLHPESLSYDSLTKAFRVLKNEPITSQTPSSGSSSSSSPPKTPALIAPHKATAMQTPETDSLPAGLSLGIGPFVTALEQAAGVEAEIVGKPTRSFFELALGRLRGAGEGVGNGGWTTSEVAVVGDDVNNDLGEGARELGLKRILVRTGKYRAGVEESLEHPPDKVYDSFATLIDDLV